MIQLNEIPEPFKSKLEATLDNREYYAMDNNYIVRCEDVNTDLGKWLISQGEEVLADEIEYKLTF
jgi:hypothetical protein